MSNEIDELKTENEEIRKALKNLQDQLKKYEEIKEVKETIKMKNSSGKNESSMNLNI